MAKEKILLSNLYLAIQSTGCGLHNEDAGEKNRGAHILYSEDLRNIRDPSGLLFWGIEKVKLSWRGGNRLRKLSKKKTNGYIY